MKLSIPPTTAAVYQHINCAYYANLARECFGTEVIGLGAAKNTAGTDNMHDNKMLL